MAHMSRFAEELASAGHASPALDTIAVMRVRVGDTRLFFDVAGMGLVADGATMRARPVVLCLHGGPGFDHSMLKPALAPLAEHAQVVFLDHRGQGRSDRSDPDHWNLDTWIADVHAFCEALEIEHPIILGQSFGGIVALGTAIRHPDLPSKLIVSSSIARFRLDRALPMFERLGGTSARRAAEAFFSDPSDEHQAVFETTCLPLYNPTPVAPEVIARVRRRPEVGYHFFRGEAFTYNWMPDLPGIRCPTLILAGALDPITTVADHTDMASAIPGARLELFPHAGHGVFRDQPEAALAIITEFAFS
jgi:pimeloyl-ACP methyl ester carboxylesterase